MLINVKRTLLVVLLFFLLSISSNQAVLAEGLEGAWEDIEASEEEMSDDWDDMVESNSDVYDEMGAFDHDAHWSPYDESDVDYEAVDDEEFEDEETDGESEIDDAS